MKVFTSLFILLFFLSLNTLYAQDLKVVHVSGYTLMSPETYEVLDEVPQEIFQFNYLCKFLGIKDTISIKKIELGFETMYKGQPFDRRLKNGAYSSNDLTIKSNIPYEDYVFNATINKGDNLNYCFTFFKKISPFKDFKHRSDEGLTVYYESYLKHIGEFKHYTLDKQLYESGNYCQVDTNYIDTISVLDPKTYEQKITIINHTKKSSKCGEWTKHSEYPETKTK